MARVWITRAEPGASQTAARIKALGHTPIVQPTLAIRALADVAAPRADAAALAFTSLNGVAVFSVLLRDHPDVAGVVRALPVFAVGDATAQAARDVGFTNVESAGGDLNSLAKLIAVRWSPDRGVILGVGAREPAGDLPDLLKARADVRPFPVYEAHATGVAAPDEFDVVLIHSPRAAAAVAIGSGLMAEACRGRVAVVISEATALPLAPLGFSGVLVAEAPTERGLLLALGKATPAV